MVQRIATGSADVRSIIDSRIMRPVARQSERPLIAIVGVGVSDFGGLIHGFGALIWCIGMAMAMATKREVGDSVL